MRKLIALLALTCALCLNVSAQSTGKVTLGWDPSPDTRVVQYKLYYGTATGVYPSSVVVAPVPPATVPPTQVTVTGLVNGQKYFFVVTAVDVVDNLESIFSNEVNTQIPFVPLPQVTGLKVISAVAK